MCVCPPIDGWLKGGHVMDEETFKDVSQRALTSSTASVRAASSRPPSLSAPAHGGGIQNSPTAAARLKPQNLCSHDGVTCGGAVVADLNISIIYDQPVSGSKPPSAGGGGALI